MMRDAARRWAPALVAIAALVAGAALLVPAASERLLARIATDRALRAPRDRWGGPLVPAPDVARGKRIAASAPGADALVDGVFRGPRTWAGGHPTPEKPAWAAIRVGSGPRRLLLSWTSSFNHCYFDQFYGAPADYRIETSADSTDGQDGTWRTAVAVAGNPVRSRAHAFDFEGQRWVRLSVTRLPEPVNEWGLFLDEIEVRDLSRGGDDVWAFVGDSIAAEVFDQAPAHRPGFADWIARAHRGYRPLTLDVGLCRLRTFEALERMDEILALNADARVIAIQLGANDGTPEMLRPALEGIVAKVRAAGKIPVVARISYQTKYGPDYAAPKDAALDEVVRAAGLLPGPDLYAWFRANPGELRDGLHPTDRGAVETARLWADSAAPLYP